MSKKGIALPLVLVLLLVLSMLGIYLNKSAQHELSFTFRSADHLRAGYIADAAIQAALAQIEENMNRDGLIREAMVRDEATVKLLTFNDLKEPYKSALSGLVDDMNNNDSGKNLIDTCCFEIKIEAAVSESLKLHKDLSDKFGDRTKRLTINARVTFKGTGSKLKLNPFVKDVTQCFGVKISDVRPVGNRYVMMVAGINDSKKDFNTGDHFFVSNKPNIGDPSEGISIGGKEALVNLFPLYSGHEDWADGIKQKTSDLLSDKSKTNSPASLIPGWDESMDQAFKPEDTDNFVADNEPWEAKNILSLAGNGASQEKNHAAELISLTGAEESKGAPSCRKGGGQVHEKSQEKILLNACEPGETKGGHKVEEHSEPIMSGSNGSHPASGNCGDEITFASFQHPLKKVNNGPFFNSGLDTGRTHLFYENCSVPCRIFGDVKKVWRVYKYESEAVNDTNFQIKVEEGPVCQKDPFGRWAVLCYHHNGYQHKPETAWDANDKAHIKTAKEELKGQYQVKVDNGWSPYDKKPVEISIDLNLKSGTNLSGCGEMVNNKFLAGATRRVEKLGPDTTLLDSRGRFYPEGVVDVADCGELKVEVNSPGMILTGKAFRLSSSKYHESPHKNKYFKVQTALGIICNDVVTISSSQNRAGICCRAVDSSGDIQLHGNLVVEKIVCGAEKKIQGRLFYDGILRADDYAADDVGDENEKACFVVSISPIPQEYFEAASLK
ncbi:MAG: hypothetical protein PHW04_18455 [Candidatus Wallbacteria bacterium]|nr:hypothetical protein [Candidatus Wallbacteria bacterium]